MPDGLTSIRPPVQGLMATLLSEIPNLTPQGMQRHFAELGLDSFGEVVLRGAVEQAIGREFTDAEWLTCETPDDVIAAAAAGPAIAGSQVRTQGDSREYRLGMPQLTATGLSESWLLKESGDFHWSLIGSALHSAPQSITDADGNRLYATVSRLRWRADPALGAFSEGDSAALSGSITRHGPGLFCSTQWFTATSGTIALEVMTTFALRDRTISQGGLVSASPQETDTGEITALTPAPEFLSGYRAVRHSGLPSGVIASCEYRIVPHHDINAVGLLYFAAYPIIADICDWQLAEGLDTGWRPVARDVCYLANCASDETLIYTLHSIATEGSGQRQIASLVRHSDGVAIAFIDTLCVAA